MSNKYSSTRTGWLRYSALLLVAFLFSQGAWAQASAYSFTEGVSTYAPLVGGTNSTAIDDDGTQNGIAIGFTFNFGGVSYTQFNLSTNGVVKLGATAISGSHWTNSIATGAVQRPFIAAIWDDGHRNLGSISYLTSGTPGSQVLEINYNGVNIGGGGSTGANVVSYSIKLYEGTNVIEIDYDGTLAAAGALTASVGINDMSSFLSVTPGATSTVSSATANNLIASLADLVSKKYTFAPPTCIAPGGLAITGVTASSLDFSWSAAVPAPTGYNWEVRTSGAAGSGASGLAASGTQAGLSESVTGLSANTSYTVYVQADCGGGDLSAWTAGVVGFTGYCASTSSGSGSFITNMVTTGASGSNLANNSAGWSATGYGDFTAQTVQSYAGSTVGFTMNITGTTVGVGVWIDWNNDLDFSDAGETAHLTTGYQGSPYSNSFTVPGGAAEGTYRMRVRINFNSSSPAACGSITRGETEDYTFEVVAAPACVPPTALTASTTETTASVSWTTGGTETLWNLEWGTSGFTLGTGTPVSGINALPYEISGLTAGTAYQYYVQSDCGGGITSSWAGPFTFSTLVPGDNCSNVIDLATLTSPYDGTTAGAAADFSFACNTNSSPDLIYSLLVPAGYTLVIGQTANGYDSENYLYYGGGCPGSTQIACYDDPDTQTNTWENTTGSDQTVYWVQDGYSGSTNFGTFTLAWSLTAPPTCPDPTALAAANITVDSAELSWTENGTGTTWNIEWGTAGFTLGSGTLVSGTTSNPYTLSGLTSSTGYQFYVQTDCGGGDLSAWVGPFSFNTVCTDVTTFPYNESFDGTTENCWEVIDANADASGTDYIWNLNYAFNARTGGQSAALYTDFSGGDIDDYLVTPGLTLTGNQRMSFWYRVQSSGEPNNMEVLLSTTDTDPASFVNVLSASTSYSNTTYAQTTIDLSAYTGTVFVAFHGVGPADGWRLYIDDVIVEDIPACPSPSALTTSNVTATSVDLNWTENGTATLWNVEIGAPGFTPEVDPILPVGGINSLPYEISGLTSGTSYEYYVQADCGGSTSTWSGPFAFTTAPGCGGSFSDPGGAGNYVSNTTYEVTICPDTPGDVVTVAFTSFATEAGWDGLMIYDGPSTASTLIASTYTAGSGAATAPTGSWNGTNSPGTVVSTDPSGCLTFRFTSDGSGNDAGWESTITCGAPPTCGNPNVSGVTPSYNTVSFTINASGIGTPAGYFYEIVLDGATPSGVGTASATNAITAPTTLTPETAYDLYIQTDCGVADGLSEWVGPISFTTNPAPPANDDCSGAITISCASTPVLGTTVNSTLDANYVDAGATGSNTTERGVWYEIIGDDNSYTITTCDPDGLVGYDTRLTVYSGSCGALTPITGNDDMSPSCGTGSFRSEVTFNAFAGTTYYLFVHGYQFGTALSTTGDFELNISCSAACVAAANDACAAAETLAENATCVNTSGETTCSTNTVGLANPTGVSIFATFNDVWYSWTASYNDYYLTFSNLTASGLIYSLYVGADCASLNATGVNGFDVVDGFQQGLFGATVGETYWIRVGVDPGVGADGTFDLCLTAIPCSTPVGSAVTATSQTNAEVVIGGIEGEDYIIEYGPAGFTPGDAGVAGVNGTIVSTSTLTNNVAVASNGNYDFYIRKDCSGAGEGYSFNEGPFTISTFLVVPFSGSASLTSCGATIYDHAGTEDYTNNANGTLVVYPDTPSSVVRLAGPYSVESGWDFIRIYDGVGTGGTLLGSFTGVGSLDVQGITLNGPVTIQFTSDGTGIDTGFEIDVTCLAACSGVPSVGVLDGPSTACSGVPFTLSVANPLVGYNYQWQRITNAGWTNIAGANSATYVATQTAPTTYRCRVTCSLTSNYLGISAPKNVGMANPATCYCTPSSAFGTSDDDYITNVTSGGINNSTGASTDPYYEEYAPGAGTTTSYAQGGEYSMDVTISSFWGDVTTAAWIDFNRNGIFEASEKLGNSAPLQDLEIATFDFIVPANASLGTTRLRVRADFNDSNIGACDETGYGETEDYTVTLVAGSANDAQANASAVVAAPYPACINYNVNLANATPSTGAGNDVWYQFVASSNAARIAVTSAFDVEIEVRDEFDAVVDAVEDASASGNETFITAGLTIGDTYWVAVRDNSGAPSTCTVCIQALNASTCDNGPNFASLCNVFKADWTGTAAYNFTFTDQVDFTVHTASTTTSTQVVLANVPGLQYGHAYDVSINSVYNLNNAAGVSEQVIAVSNSTCAITIAPAPAVNLRASDRDPVTRNIGAFIGTDISVCAVVSWDWSFELVDDFGDPLTIDGPVVINTGSASRYFRTSSIPGVAAGDRYRVRVRPVFASGAGSFDDASFYYLRISGGAGIIEGGNDATPSENTFVVGNGSGASAAIYPNPSNGEMVNLNLAGIDSDNVNVRILDATGRLVWSNRYVVEGSLNTIVSFDRPLAAGLYIVEMAFGNEVITERMMVQK